MKAYQSIDGISKSVDNTTEQFGANRDVDNGSSTLYNVTFLDELVVTEDHNTDIVGLQIKSHTLNKMQIRKQLEKGRTVAFWRAHLETAGKLHHLFGLNVL